MMRRAVTRRAKALGVEVQFHADRHGPPFEHEITLEAPAGFVLEATGTHGAVARGDASDGEDGTPWSVLYGSALEDLSLGVRRCDDEGCDCCEGDDDDEQAATPS